MNSKSYADMLRPTNVISAGPRDAQVVTYTTSGARMTGVLDGTPSYTRQAAKPSKRYTQYTSIRLLPKAIVDRGLSMLTIMVSMAISLLAAHVAGLR